MSEKDINNLKEMLVDFNEYSTDYTKTRCRELEETIENTLKEIKRLNNIINELDKQNVELGTKLSLTTDKYEKKLFIKENIIKEVREYIDKWKFEAGGNGACMNYDDIVDILEILDKEKDNE